MINSISGENIEIGDITNYGRVIGFTISYNYIIQDRGVVGCWQNVFKVKTKNEEEVSMLAKSPIE